MNENDSNPAEDFLNVVEAVGSLVSTLDMIREGLEERGWDSRQAQAAATMAYDNVMKHSLIDHQAAVFGKRE